MAIKTHYSVTDLQILHISESDQPLLSDFHCGEDCIDHFIHKEALICDKYNYLKCYKVIDRASDIIVGVFTLANDVFKLEFEDRQDYPVPSEYDDIFQEQAVFPAINIGHLAVRDKFQSKGIGSTVINYVKYTVANYSFAG